MQSKSMFMGNAMEKDFSLAFNYTKEKIEHPAPCEIPIKKLKDEVKPPVYKQWNRSIKSNFKDVLETITDEIIKSYYEIEQSILRNGFIPDDLLKRLAALQDLNTSCKKNLKLRDPHKVDFPQEFTNEYSFLILRAENAISRINEQISNDYLNTDRNPYNKETCRRLETLKLLCLHYKKALGI